MKFNINNTAKKKYNQRMKINDSGMLIINTSQR